MFNAMLPTHRIPCTNICARLLLRLFPLNSFLVEIECALPICRNAPGTCIVQYFRTPTCTRTYAQEDLQSYGIDLTMVAVRNDTASTMHGCTVTASLSVPIPPCLPIRLELRFRPSYPGAGCRVGDEFRDTFSRKVGNPTQQHQFDHQHILSGNCPAYLGALRKGKSAFTFENLASTSLKKVE